MTYSELRTSLESYFSANWVSTPILWENSKENTPETAWVRFVIRPAISQNAELGSNQNRISGEVVIQVFIPLDTGLVEGWTLADALNTLFQSKVIGKVYLYTGTTNIIGDASSQGYYQLNVSYRFDAQ